MFGNGMTEWLLVFVVGLLVLGPERLPAVARSVGRVMGRAKNMLADVQRELGESVPADELKQVSDNVKMLRQSNVKTLVRRVVIDEVERKQG
ncbi:Sec-independent protein translocase protein TatB [Pseudomonas sp. 5Ae-yellow]|jgi:sec-independent protein translocase protein TatB|uniref:Sec-independent protein translocase protein TatB n=1 Tax=Pseudomonas sp. 5Ae-yellow TaxID=2759848 RepID=UPI000C989A7C|nr:Sec-independent protein translocase protein TatB [Pseudomonas sp. 5Ae-yellow]MAB25766.1 twin-arginine translocase subunit TatB [Pseudomonadales bacterium]MBA6418993.1 twin-arginine translocase subunit TatB [Pseudomonas sp. 5Ae-yellow]|tara:strand:+ start:2499 stop:2774 length:276 start_codon:yes stop_codon:yes gene_type:complete